MIRLYNFDQIIRGARVALVGPGETIIGSNLGSYIDSFDVVCRLGRDIELHENEKKDIGSRTNVVFENFWDTKDFEHLVDVYSSQKILVRHVREIGTSWYNKFTNECLSTTKKVHLSIRDTREVMNVWKEIGACPQKGILAIDDIMRHDPKRLFVCGMTFFYKTGYKPSAGYTKEYDDECVKVAESGGLIEGHNCKKELEYFINLACEDRRIMMDEPLRQIVRESLKERISVSLT